MFSIYNELTKLRIYCKKNNISKIDKKIIDDLVYEQSMINSFDILDSMLFDRSKTLRMIENLQKN